MKAIFIGSPFPDNRHNEIIRESIGIIDNAANNFQSALIKGLQNFYPDLKVISLPVIGEYPKGYKKIKFAASDFVFDSQIVGYTLGFINLPGLKHYSRYNNLKHKLKEVLDPEKDTTIFVYGMHSPYLKAINDLNYKYKIRVKTCLIVPDLPQFMSGNNNPVYRLLKWIDSNFIKKYLQKISSFVFLTKYMAEELNVNERPWIVVEGIFVPKKDISVSKPQNLKVILYTGNLAKRYGIANLLEGFTSLKNEEFRLWICGDGDYKEEIINETKKDDRIKYLGQLPYKKIFELQQEATVLVNPRTSEGDFTKYSFPSKTMEYMGSGTPTIIHPLPGIPAEYFDYVFVAKTESSEGLKDTILTVCNKSEQELAEFGKKAKSFVTENKTPQKQCLKIYKMLESL